MIKIQKSRGRYGVVTAVLSALVLSFTVTVTLASPAAAACIDEPTAPGSGNGTIKIGTYNVAGDADHRTAKKLNRGWVAQAGSRSTEIAIRVAKYAPDIVGFQEVVDPTTSNPLRSSLECRGYTYGGGFDGVSGLEIYYNPKAWTKVLGVGGEGNVPPKPVTGEYQKDGVGAWLLDPDAGEDRGYVWRVFVSKYDSTKKFIVVNTHLSSAGGHSRAVRNRTRVIQLKDIILNRLPATTTPIIFLGDFNDYGYKTDQCNAPEADMGAGVVAPRNASSSQTFCFMTDSTYQYRDGASPYGLKGRVTTKTWKSAHNEWNINRRPLLAAGPLAVADDMLKYSTYFTPDAGLPASGAAVNGRHLDHIYFPSSMTVTNWRAVLETTVADPYTSAILGGTAGVAASTFPAYADRDSDHSFVWSTASYPLG